MARKIYTLGPAKDAKKSDVGLDFSSSRVYIENVLSIHQMEYKMKADKFKELADKRVARALKQFRLIGNLSNRGSYEYSEEQVDKIFIALQAELSRAKTRFTRKTANGGAEFSL